MHEENSHPAKERYYAYYVELLSRGVKPERRSLFTQDQLAARIGATRQIVFHYWLKEAPDPYKVIGAVTIAALCGVPIHPYEIATLYRLYCAAFPERISVGREPITAQMQAVNPQRETGELPCIKKTRP